MIAGVAKTGPQFIDRVDQDAAARNQIEVLADNGKRFQIAVDGFNGRADVRRDAFRFLVVGKNARRNRNPMMKMAPPMPLVSNLLSSRNSKPKKCTAALMPPSSSTTAATVKNRRNFLRKLRSAPPKWRCPMIDDVTRYQPFLISMDGHKPPSIPAKTRIDVPSVTSIPAAPSLVSFRSRACVVKTRRCRPCDSEVHLVETAISDADGGAVRAREVLEMQRRRSGSLRLRLKPRNSARPPPYCRRRAHG